MSIERARRASHDRAAEAREQSFLQAQWAAHQNDFRKWWNHSPVANSTEDIAQWFEIVRTTSGVALEMLQAATEMSIASSRLKMPAENSETAWAAVMNVDLGGSIAYLAVDPAHDIRSGDLAGCKMFGALCWQFENAGLHVIPFASQNGRDAAFGHVVFDAAGAWNQDQPNVAIHPGLSVVCADGSVILPVDLASHSLCGATVRAGTHMAHLVVGALWSLEASHRK